MTLALFITSEHGASAIEYALLAGLACGLVWFQVRWLDSVFDTIRIAIDGFDPSQIGVPHQDP